MLSREDQQAIARQLGYSGDFGGGAFSSWATQNGLNDDFDQIMADRTAARQNGYQGQFGGGAYNAYQLGIADQYGNPNLSPLAFPLLNLGMGGFGMMPDFAGLSAGLDSFSQSIGQFGQGIGQFGQAMAGFQPVQTQAFGGANWNTGGMPQSGTPATPMQGNAANLSAPISAFGPGAQQGFGAGSGRWSF